METMKKEQEDLNNKLKRQIISYEHLTKQSKKYDYSYPISTNTDPVDLDDPYRQTVRIDLNNSKQETILDEEDEN